MSVVGAAALEEGRCTNLKVALDGNNLHLYPEEVVRGLAAAQGRALCPHGQPEPEPEAEFWPLTLPSLTLALTLALPLALTLPLAHRSPLALTLPSSASRSASSPPTTPTTPRAPWAARTT